MPAQTNYKKAIQKFWGEFRDEDVMICVGVYQPDLAGEVKLEIAKHAGHGSLITIGIGFAMSYMWELVNRVISPNAEVELITTEIPGKFGKTNWISIGSARINDRTGVLRLRIEEKFEIDWELIWDETKAEMKLHNSANDGDLYSDVKEENGRNGTDYALIVKAPYQDDKWAVLIGGCKTYGIWAAAEALKDQKFIEEIAQRTQDHGDVPLSIVIKTEVVSGVPQERLIHAINVLKPRGQTDPENPRVELVKYLDEKTSRDDISSTLFNLSKSLDNFAGQTNVEKWREIFVYYHNRGMLTVLKKAICTARDDLCERVTLLMSRIDK